MQNRLVFPALSLIAVLGILYFMTPAPRPDLVVVRTDSGFAPSTITIHRGQAIVFKNESSNPIWPASDFHPTHSLYPEFDPKASIAPGTSWRFVFTKVGTWTYHDHLDEGTRGIVQVLGMPGAGATLCTGANASSTAVCRAAELTETLNAKGFDAAFDLYRAFYLSDPTFRGLNCHDAGHILGAAAYKRYKNDHTVIDRPETSYCGYGFYHGFMETMLVEEGSGHYDDVRNYCAALEHNGTLDSRSGACFHGIGHAVFDSLPGSLWGDPSRMAAAALSICGTILSRADEYHQCSTGVFNSLANAMSAHSYNLSFDTADPLSICRSQPHAIQDGCYKEVGIGAIRDAFMDRAASLTFIRAGGDTEQIGWLLNAYAGDEATRHLDDMGSLASLCTAFSTSDLRTTCVKGVISGLMNVGEPGREYARVFSYCDAYAPAETRALCFRTAVPITRALAADPQAFLMACKTVAPNPKVCTM